MCWPSRLPAKRRKTGNQKQEKNDEPKNQSRAFIGGSKAGTVRRLFRWAFRTAIAALAMMFVIFTAALAAVVPLAMALAVRSAPNPPGLVWWSARIFGGG